MTVSQDPALADTAPAPDMPLRGKAGPVFAGQVRLEDVRFSTRRRTIIDGVSLTVEAGQIACLLGPSGCGKTTLLRLVAGILEPSAGRILLDGAVMAGDGRMVPPERRNIGLVFQDFALFPHLTALENVAYGLYALSRAEALRVARLALERVALGHVMHSFPAALSGGEQQRVALARALVPRPQVILLDEPFSGLDQRLKESVRDDALSLLRETRATAILVTHDPEEALAFADRVHVMQQGRIAQSGSPGDILHRPNSAAVARFFRNYNCFNAQVRNARATTALGIVPADAALEGRMVDVLVAPAAIQVVPIGQGTPALIVENRDMGLTRRIIARIQGHDAPVLIHANVSTVGEAGLVLAGKDTHIFPVDGG